MEQYDVVSLDEKRVGRVVGETGEFYIVEAGGMRKTRHALPKRYASVNDEKRSVRA